MGGIEPPPAPPWLRYCVVMKQKCPYTELKSSVLPCLDIAADILQEGKKAVSKVRKIPLSDSTTKRRCDDISKDC